MADQVLGAHIAPTAFFKTLEQATLSTISFQTLEMSATDPQHIAIKMAGIAESVNSIALQADLFSKNGAVTSPIFSDITRQSDGVHFNMTALINPASVSYVHMVNDAAHTQSAQTPQPNPLNASPFSPQTTGTQNQSTQTTPPKGTTTPPSTPRTP
ncbi:hypothetical protein HY970_03935 [Candidatus Kaiserbacteria bacterium]|nr:hypothetical protein [Candidatus Kaiserbacteria bacterium]